MSIHVLSWVLKHSPVDDPRQRLVLLVLADHADDEGGNSFPKRETIATESKLPLRRVTDCIDALRQAGHIEEMARTGYNNRTVVWRVVMDQRATAIGRIAPDSKGPQSGERVPEQSGERVPDSRVEASKEPSEPSVEAEDGSGRGREAWQRIRKEMAVTDFIDHVWLEPLQPLEVRQGFIRLGAPRSHHGWVKERYLDGIRTTASAIAGRPVEVELVPMHEAAPDAAGRQAPGAGQN